MVSIIRDTPFRAAYVVHKPADDPNADRVAVYLIVQTGEADLTGPQGMLHYVEHLAWLDATKRSARSADRDSNAWTNQLSVGYWLAGTRADLPRMITQLSRVFDPITLRPSFVRQERDILLREYDLRIRDNMDARVAEDLSRAIYRGTGYARSPLATPLDISSLGVDAALALHRRTHRPGNAVLVVYGNVSDDAVAAAIPDLPKGPRSPARRVPFTAKLPRGKPSDSILRFPDPDASPHIVWRRIIRLDQPQQIDLLAARLALLRDVLDTNLPGGLAGPLRFDAFIARRFSISLSALDESHVEMIFSAEPDEGVSLNRLKTSFEAVLASSARAGIPAATYTRVRKRFSDYWPEWLDRQKLARWMAGYVVDAVSARKTPLDVVQLGKLDSRITRDDLNDLLRQLVSGGRTVVAFVGNEGDLN